MIEKKQILEAVEALKEHYSGIHVPETDEEALAWLADKPAAARDLYLLYRLPEAFNMDVQTALYETLKKCVPSLSPERASEA